MPMLSQPAEKGAVPLLLAAAGKEAKRGAYYGPTGMGDLKGPVGDASVTNDALDQTVHKRLWEESEKLVKEVYEFNQQKTT